MDTGNGLLDTNNLIILYGASSILISVISSIRDTEEVGSHWSTRLVAEVVQVVGGGIPP